MNRFLSILAIAATLTLAACGEDDLSRPGSSCSIDLPANTLVSGAEEAARSLGGSPCGLSADPTLRAHLVRIEKGDNGEMRAVMRVVSEE